MKIKIAILFTLVSSLSTGQTLCDGKMPDSSSFIFSIVEVMPQASMSRSEVEELLNESIDLDEFNLSGIYNVFISFIVNCKGEAFYFHSPRSYHKEFEEKVISVLKEKLEWKNGSQRGNPVDVQMTLHLKLYDGQIEMSGLER